MFTSVVTCNLIFIITSLAGYYFNFIRGRTAVWIGATTDLPCPASAGLSALGILFAYSWSVSIA